MLKQTLLSLNHQTDKNFEVVVSDDGSNIESQNKIKELQQQLSYRLTYLWQKDLGFRAAKARNEGIKKANGDYIIFTDGDCILPASFVAQHRKLALKNHFVDGNRILLSEKFTKNILNQDEIFNINIKSLFKYRIAGKINKISSYLKLPLGPFRLLRSTKWKGVKTCNLAAWKQDLMEVNGFDESFQGWGHEDADLVIRLIKNRVKRQSGKYASVVFHQWHKVNDRKNEIKNKAALLNSINSANVKANNGLEKIQ